MSYVPRRSLMNVPIDLGSSVSRPSVVHARRGGERLAFGFESCWARVIQVDPDTRVARIQGLGPLPFTASATWLSPYAHGGSKVEGIDFIPREESICMVQRINRQWQIIGFGVPSSGAVKGKGQTGFSPDYSGLRPKNYAQGDFVVGTVDDNYAAFTSDGAIELVSRALTKFILEPLAGLGRLFLKNYELKTKGGHETWWSSEDDDEKSEHEGVYKDTPVAGKDNRVVIKKGKNGDVLETTVKKRLVPGVDQFNTTYRFHVDADGNVTVTADGDVTLDVSGSLTAKARSMTFEADATIVMKANSAIALQGRPILENSGLPSPAQEIIAAPLAAPGQLSLGALPLPAAPISISNLTSGLELVQGVDFTSVLDGAGLPTNVIDYTDKVDLGDNLDIRYDTLVP